MNASEKYDRRARDIDSLLCVGLDADFEKIPERFKKLEFPQFEFNKWIIEETHEYAAAYKPNSAFYEARGDAGMKELKMTMDYLIRNHPDIFTICDAKRADIGNTNRGYVSAIFDWLGFDAVTVNPYLGREAVQPFLDRKDKVSIILCRTSNPGSGEFQSLEFSGKHLWQIIAETVAGEWNANQNCMLVAGAAHPDEIKKLRELAPEMTFLVPGIGAQGGDLEAVLAAGLDQNGRGLIINSSRGIIFSENPKEEARRITNHTRIYRGKFI
ncbi:MAG TPA: orotidine-5'-phosphate decarboxylase [Candidatus Paceibacterota bacterium]|jgi:orotidine 5'-phosphate decarboxylase subfamily 2|nr:orotidine-5'-phosphate decarboxylase [Candidatus Paceibacterota bacterium]